MHIIKFTRGIYSFPALCSSKPSLKLKTHFVFTRHASVFGIAIKTAIRIPVKAKTFRM